MPWSMAKSHPFIEENKLIFSNEAEPTHKGFDSRIFPFQPTPSGNLKVIPQQVVFESKGVSVLVADPTQARVNIKADLAKQQQELTGKSEGIAVDGEKDAKMMESEDARNSKRHQILNAITLMGGEARGAALSQLMSPSMPPSMTLSQSPKFKIASQIPATNEGGFYPAIETGNDHDKEDGGSDESDDSPKPEVNLIKLGFLSSTPIDWNKIKLPQKTNLYKHMHYRITNYVNPDCLVQIDDVQFNCHLLVLQCYSAFFNEKTSKEVVKLQPQNVTAKAFELIYEWMTYVHGDSYTILTRDNILEVFLAAQYLGIKELEEQCWAFVDCEDLFKEDTAFMLYLEAKKYGISAIMELMIPRVMKFFLTLVSSKDFLDLQLDEVNVLLSSNYISVHSEIEIFMSAVRWLWHDWKERKEYLEQIMSCIRFGLIAPWQLVDIRRNPENPEFLEITSHPSVQQMIDNGLAYAIIKYWYGNQTEDYYHWIDLLGLSEPPSRNWAGEEKNYITYREFLHDLEMYRKDLYHEKEKIRSKRESVSSSKSKRTSEQSGMTTSPRDALQLPVERRSSTKKHSPLAIKTGSLADTMRNEIVRKCGFLAAPPPTIWNINAMMREVPMIVTRSGSRATEIREDSIRKVTNSIQKSTPSYEESFTLYRKESATWCSSNPSFLTIAKSRCRLDRDHAAIIIQRAYRRYRRERKQLECKSQFLTSPADSYKSHKSLRNRRLRRQREPSEGRKPMMGKFNVGHLKSALPKDYLKEGSLFLADRESVIVFGGIDPHSKYGDGKNTGRNIFRYHSELNQWDLVGELPQPRHHHAVAFLKGRVYLAGGTDPRDDDKGKTFVVSTVWSFEPVTRAWYKETNMKTPRKNFGLIAMNGKLMAIGGQDKDGRILYSVEKYDTVTGVWEYITPLNVERTGAAIAKYRDVLWVAGGMTSSRKFPLTSTVESYDPKFNSWKEQSPLRFPRCFGCMFAMNDVLYHIGGAGHTSEKERITSSCNSVDVWNPVEEEWKLHNTMSVPRHGHAVAYLGTQILIIGGVTTAYLRALSDVECFCCERKIWVKGLANLPVPLSGHGAVTLPPASLM